LFHLTSLSACRLILGILSTILPNLLLPHRDVPSSFYDDDYSMLVKLWDALKGDWYLVHTISLAFPSSQRQVIHGRISRKRDPNSVGIGGNTSSEYQLSLSRHLYRNSMLSRMRLPYRYIASFQVRINLSHLLNIHLFSIIVACLTIGCMCGHHAYASKISKTNENETCE